MTEKWFCDRCGVEVDEHAYRLSVNRSTSSTAPPVDLCVSCFEDFHRWLDAPQRQGG